MKTLLTTKECMEQNGSIKQVKVSADAAHYHKIKELLCLLELEDYIEAEYDGNEIYLRACEGKEALIWGTF